MSDKEHDNDNAIKKKVGEEGDDAKGPIAQKACHEDSLANNQAGVNSEPIRSAASAQPSPREEHIDHPLTPSFPSSFVPP